MNDKTISLNCPSCGPLAARINEAKLDPHRQYAPMIKDLTALEQRGIIELLAGDCPLEDTLEVLTAERHYTVCHYLRCRSCGAIYFIGACIRGNPVYRRVENMAEENADFRLCGRCGSCYA